MNKAFSIREALLFGITAFVRNISTFIAVFASIGVMAFLELVVALFLPYAYDMEPFTFATDWPYLLNKIFILVFSFTINYGLMLGVMRICLDIVQTGSSSYKRLFSSFRLVPRVALAELLFGLIVTGVVLLLYFPVSMIHSFTGPIVELGIRAHISVMFFVFLKFFAKSYVPFFPWLIVGSICPACIEALGALFAFVVRYSGELIMPAFIIVITLFGFYKLYLLDRGIGVIDAFATSLALARKALGKLFLLYSMELIVIVPLLFYFTLTPTEFFMRITNKTLVAYAIFGALMVSGIVALLANTYAYNKLQKIK